MPKSTHLQNKQQQQVITIVSDGVVYKGVRTPEAFAWVYSHDLAPRREATPAAASAASIYALAFVQKANLSKDDKRACRSAVVTLSGKELHSLVGSLRGYRRGGR